MFSQLCSLLFLFFLCTKERKRSKESQCVSTWKSAIIVLWESGLKGNKYKAKQISVTADFVSFFLGWDTFLTCVRNELLQFEFALIWNHWQWMHPVHRISDNTTTAKLGLSPSSFKGKQVLLLLAVLQRSGNNGKTGFTLQTHCEYSSPDSMIISAKLWFLWCLDLTWFGFFSEMELRWNVTFKLRSNFSFRMDWDIPGSVILLWSFMCKNIVDTCISHAVKVATSSEDGSLWLKVWRG